jgi:hypothetical protein
VRAVVDGKTVATYRGDAITVVFFPWRQATIALGALVALALAGFLGRHRIASWRRRRAEERAVIADWRRNHPPRATTHGLRG